MLLKRLKRWLGWDSDSGLLDFGNFDPRSRPSAAPPKPIVPMARTAEKPATPPRRPKPERSPMDVLDNPRLTLDKPADDGRGYTIEQWVEEMDGRGVRLTGQRLRPPADATTIRVRGGQLLVTDGPFVETKEFMGGFDLLECADLDEAIEIASKHPSARAGMIEIRPFWPLF